MTDRIDVQSWVDGYERAWRTPATGALSELSLTKPPTFRRHGPSPYGGLQALADFWESERENADEVFTMASEIVAVDGATAVVRVAVEYGRGSRPWRDLWILRLDGNGRCTAFEEWPFAPEQDDGH